MPISTAADAVVCTVFEKKYHLGVAALTNSLYRQGYRGILYAGVRGALPPWAAPVTLIPGGHEWLAADGLRIHFISIETTRHLTYYKPHFMMQVLRDLAPQASAVLYFDPDITIKADWSFFADWVKGHIALCEDLNWRFHHSHPIRRSWEKLLEPHDIAPVGTMDVYCNAGFVGVDRSHLAFLDRWETILKIIERDLAISLEITVAERSYAFHKGDQDAMNIAVDCFPEALSLLGPEGMDFVSGGYTMSHAVGDAKPWSKKFTSSALIGKPPTLADKAFWENIRKPIPVFSLATRLWKWLDLKSGSALGRFIRRT